MPPTTPPPSTPHPPSTPRSTTTPPPFKRLHQLKTTLSFQSLFVSALHSVLCVKSVFTDALTHILYCLTQYNITLLPSVNTIARGMFCGEMYIKVSVHVNHLWSGVYVCGCGVGWHKEFQSQECPVEVQALKRRKCICDINILPLQIPTGWER